MFLICAVKNKNAERKTNLVVGCGYKTINTDISTGQSEDVKSTGQSEDVESTLSSQQVSHDQRMSSQQINWRVSSQQINQRMLSC